MPNVFLSVADAAVRAVKSIGASKAIGKAKDSKLVKQLVSWRTGVPHKSAHGDIRHLARWLQSWPYICIDRNATAVAQNPVQLFRRKDTSQRSTRRIKDRVDKAFLKANYGNQWTEDAVMIDEHPFIDLMANPNPILAGTGLLWLTSAALQAMGEAFWHISFDSDGMPNEIWPLPSQLVFPILGENRVYDFYELRIGGFIQRFPAEEIIHFRKPSLIDTLGAMGALRGIIEAAETNTKMLEFERAIFENMGVPDIILIPKGQTSAAQVESLVAVWNEKYKGWLRRGEVGAAPVELDVKRLGLTMRELQHKDTRNAVVEEICAGLGVPLPIVKVDGTTFNNLHNGMLLWGKFTVVPIQCNVADTINCRMMPYYLPRNEFEAYDDVVPARPQYWVAFPNPVPEDEDAQEQRSTSRLTSFKTTINEERAVDGEEPVPWGDEPHMPAGLVTPTQAVVQQDFDRSLAEGEAARQVALDQTAADQVAAGAEASIEAQPPTFGELVQALTMYKDGSDTAAYNMIRDAMASRFGVNLPSISEIAPNASVGVVDPKNAADPVISPTQENNDDAKPETSNGNGKEEPAPSKPKKPKRDAASESKDKEITATYVNAREATSKQARRLQLAAQRAVKWYGGGTDDEAAKYGFEPGVAEAASDSLAKAIATVYHDFIEEIIASLKDVLSQVGDDLSSVRMFGETAESRTTITKELTQAMVTAAIKKDKWIHEFGEAAIPFLEVALKRGESLGQQDLQGRIDTIRPVGAATIAQHAQVMADQFASSTVDTTGDEVFAIINEALAEGLGTREVTSKLGLMFDAKKDSAQMIARTEMNNAMNFAAAETWRTNGVKEHEWFAAPDACEFCDVLDGKVITIGMPFVKMGATVRGSEGGTYTANYKSVTHPTLHPRCRCTLLPVV